MTPGVVTASADADVLSVAQLMRDRSVGSVVICDSEGEPAMVTDRDLAVQAWPSCRRVGCRACLPAAGLGDPGMDLEEAALVLQHRVRRLPVIDGALVGIVISDIAAATGSLEVAQRDDAG